MDLNCTKQKKMLCRISLRCVNKALVTVPGFYINNKHCTASEQGDLPQTKQISEPSLNNT